MAGAAPSVRLQPAHTLQRPGRLLLLMLYLPLLPLQLLTHGLTGPLLLPLAPLLLRPAWRVRFLLLPTQLWQQRTRMEREWQLGLQLQLWVQWQVCPA